jgi:hypothetical protein
MATDFDEPLSDNEKVDIYLQLSHLTVKRLIV